MGLSSYSDEPMPQQVPLTIEAIDEFGGVPLTETWENFYKAASQSDETYLVKTHLPPPDDQPAIYVVRDGRQSLFSYLRYHRKFFPDHNGGLFELALGEDYYGGWSEHYDKWVNGRSNVLLLRYEDLVNADSECVNVVAQFVGHAAPVVEWTNPFDKLHQASPDFFRVGDHEWKRPPEWSDLINGVFFMRHGDLMHHLGYAARADIDLARSTLPHELRNFVLSA
jgi:hypothetical protein